MPQSRKFTPPTNVKIGRMIAREFGVKKCTRDDALEIHNWVHGLSHDQIQSITVRNNPMDALDIALEQ